METAKGKTREEAITRLADRIDSFKNYSNPHSRLMANLATHLARRLGLTQPDIHAVAEAAFLHDIGLHAMTPAYQLTPGPLSFEERMDLWRHPIIGEQQMAKRDAMRHSQLLVRWHHEWWNGSGYPDQLSFEDIPIGARILRAVELYAALIADRPYRAALSHEQAIDTLKASAGVECDAYIVKALAALIEDIRASGSQTIRESSPISEPPASTQAFETSAVSSSTPAIESSQPVESAASQTDSMQAQYSAGESSTVMPPSIEESSQAKEPARVESLTSQAGRESEGDASRLSPALKLAALLNDFNDDQSAQWRGWSGSRYNKKSLLGFEASVLRQIEFRSIAIPFCGWARVDLYLKAWGKHILANDPRAWAGTVARATVEAKVSLNEEHIARVLEDVYVPGARLMNPDLRRWFSETDAWWMDNLRRNIEALDDEALRAQAMMLGLMTGDYALSFNDETRDLRRPLTTVFWRLAGRAFLGTPGHPHNRSYNLPAEEFIKQARSDLLYLTLPSAPTAQAGSEARSEWRESWVRKATGAEAEDALKLMTSSQSKNSYLSLADKLLRAASHIRIWAIEYQEAGPATAAEVAELIKEHRPVRATYSKDLTEVVGGLRNYIIVAERASGT